MIDAKDLPHFTGTSKWYTLPHLGKWKQTKNAGYEKPLMTDGAKYVLDNGGEGGAYWLWDVISSHIQTDDKLRDQSLLVCKLVVDLKETTAVLTIEDGNYNQLAEQRIPFTDFDLPSITLWYSGGVLLLPSEY